MTGAAPAWAVWLALGLWGVAIILLAVAVALARRYWRALRPRVAPYLLASGLGGGDNAAVSGGMDKGQAAAAGSDPSDALCANCGTSSSEHTQESGGCPPDCQTHWRTA